MVNFKYNLQLSISCPVSTVLLDTADVCAVVLFYHFRTIEYFIWLVYLLDKEGFVQRIFSSH